VNASCAAVRRGNILLDSNGNIDEKSPYVKNGTISLTEKNEIDRRGRYYRKQQEAEERL
jgi:hypothetical protein